MRPAADLFSGLGGFSEGARRSGLVDVQFAANHWPEAVEWHRRNHPETHHECQDLAQMDMRILPGLTDGVLIAAPACQGHSQCGQPAASGTGGNYSPDPAVLRRKHQADRNTAWAVLAAADTARPSRIVVENVPDFLRWPVFDAWAGVLRAMGYNLTWAVHNALDYGAPQDRSRLILVGSLDGEIAIESPGLTAGSIGSCLEPDEHAGNRWARVAAKPERTRAKMRRAQAQAGPRCFWNNVSESRGRDLGEPFPTVTTKSGSQMYLLDGDRCRILNPRELARAQSFPETYAIPEHRGLASKLIGNAIDVRVACSVLEQVAAA